MKTMNYDDGLAHRFNQIGMGINLDDKIIDVPVDNIINGCATA